MPLSRAQLAMVERARAIGGAGRAAPLSEAACAYIVATVVADLGLGADFPELPAATPEFFGNAPGAAPAISGAAFLPLLERLLTLAPDADTYFASLAKLYKARLKYDRILSTQPIPTMEQVGPRALLEYGKIRPAALGALILWRKWLFDIDNRAAQETGYLFEPIIASAIGGVSTSARRSPVRRHGDPTRGRQVDCIKDGRAYEFKLRVTIAASGQGRWREELDFPQDCRESGFVPVLVVLDSTPNPKILELVEAFEAEKGETYIGRAAWERLNEMAGPIMAVFLKRYVRDPVETVLQSVPDSLPDLSIGRRGDGIVMGIGGESFRIARSDAQVGSRPRLPDDVDEEASGP